MSNIIPDPSETDTSNQPFDLKDYVDSTNDAASRSRHIYIILVVTSILIFIGLNNSYRNSWMLSGMRHAYSPDDANVVDLLAPGTEQSPLFKAGDFQNIPALISKLKDTSNGLSNHLRGRFEATTLQMLQDTNQNYMGGDSLETLVADFNKLLRDPSLHNAELFQGTGLRRETKALLEQKPRREEMFIILNRMLLEDAYPNEIARKNYNVFFEPTFIPQTNEGKDVLIRPADQFKRDFQWNLMRTYLDNMLLVRIPILGVAIHVNDLGLIGGVTLIVLLLMMRTSLSREIKNLNYSFKKAAAANQLDEFYHALGMRQLFTIPHMRGERRNRILSKAPYAVCLLPVIVYLLLAAYDGYTAYLYARYNKDLFSRPLLTALTKPVASFILWLIFIEGFCALMISLLSLRCLERQSYVYNIWDSYWKLLPLTPNYCLLEPAVAVHFQKERGVDSSAIKAALGQIAESIKQPKKKNLLQRLWRALREEHSPIFHFLFHKQETSEQPHLIEIDPDLAELFSNDKQINDVLRQFLKQQGKEKQNSASSGTSGSSKDSV